MNKMKRMMVFFTETQWNIIQKLRGEFGDNDTKCNS